MPTVVVDLADRLSFKCASILLTRYYLLTLNSKAVVAKAKTAAPRVMDSAPAVKNGGTGSILGWLVAILFGGALLGTYLADSLWMGEFDAEESMVVIDDKTWMPVGGVPVSVVVLNDENCGAACNTKAGLDSLRASVTPALKVETIDVNSKEGQELIETFELVSVPQYFFGEDLEDFEVPNPQDPEGEPLKFIDNLPAGLLTQKDDLYYIDGARVGFKPGKFITPPEFSMTDEPTLGSGPVKVVEFTDMQCPYCKRFHDQNKALINRLVAENKITYVLKDFPLSFHKEAYEGMHKAANCVLKEGGNEAYFGVKDAIFANQASFNGIGTLAAEAQIAGYASEEGVDIESCLVSESTALRAEVQADIAEGGKYGVTGTPSVFVGTQILPGAVGPQVVEAAVNAELQK